ncbi:hypothetical protein DP106_14900 [Halonotius pteroides]|uniref:Uncharacterized protein n=1 Tax=Halonotius pteroides TaxID=268735 RepID=A0A3A6Q5T3_9EURY|nr:hypothetical protein DP106_14900 [Halonotius pteroides]
MWCILDGSYQVTRKKCFFSDDNYRFNLTVWSLPVERSVRLAFRRKVIAVLLKGLDRLFKQSLISLEQ